eukprot:5581246-Amphidinium_carterae.1
MRTRKKNDELMYKYNLGSNTRMTSHVLRECSQGCNEQGVVTVDQQSIICGSRQEVIDSGTVAA